MMKTSSGNIFSGLLACCLALLAAVLGGCGAALVDDPELLARSTAVVRASADGESRHGALHPEFWRPDARGLDAVLVPKSRAYGQSGLALSAMYRLDADGNARFALFLPQGGKLGQCERRGAGLSCESASFTGASQLVRACFWALDEVAALRPDLNDSYELRAGDGRIGIDSAETVLVRARRVAQKAYFVIYKPDGPLVGAYMRGTGGKTPSGKDLPGRNEPGEWKAVFGEKSGSYIFYPALGTLSVEVSVTRCVTGD